MTETQRSFRRFLSPCRVQIEKLNAPGTLSVWERLRGAIFGVNYEVSRALLHFERFERPRGRLSPELLNAVRLTAAARSPHMDPGFFVEWGREAVSVWSWCRSDLERRGVPNDGWVVPERLSADERSAGFSLRPVSEGWEAVSINQSGEYLMSRFWPHEPDDAAVERLRRIAEPEPSGVQATSSQLSLYERGMLAVSERLSPLTAGLVALAIFALPLGVLLGDWVVLSAKQSRIETDIAQFAQASDGAMRDLQRYQRLSRRAANLQEGFVVRQPLLAAVDIAEVAAELGAQVEEFDISDTVVRARVSAPQDLGPAVLVERLEGQDILVGVTIERETGREGWLIQSELAAMQ